MNDAIVFLHDVTGEPPLANPAWQTFLTAHQLTAITPTMDEAWWAGEDVDLIERTLNTLETDGFNIRAIAGIGTGGHAALRLAFLRKGSIPITFGIDPACDLYAYHGYGYHLDALYPTAEACRQDTAVMHVHPSRYPAHIGLFPDPESFRLPGSDRLHEKLWALGIEHVYEVTPAEMVMERCRRFLAEALLVSRRRLA